MAKKRFTDDLFDLFEDSQLDATPEEAAPAVQEDASEEETVEVEVPVRGSKAKRKLSSKKFTADLDAFLTQDMARSEASPAATSPRKAPAATPRRRRKAGLDLLIRSTVSKEEMAERSKPVAKDTKRVTLVFNKSHLVTLKEQAKDRGMYLKDVVQEMVSQYLSEEG